MKFSLVLPFFVVASSVDAFAPSPYAAPTATTITTSRSSSTTRLHGVFDSEIDRLFDKYDADNNGSIDRDEFRAIAQAQQASSRRREIISVAAAAYGSFFVAEKSNTFQWAQKNFRSNYIEEEAEFSQQLVFPTALLSGDVDNAIFKTLKKRGFTPQNTLFGHSVCSDEVNNREEQLLPLMVNRWGEGFTLGGLAGLPFAGKSGFGAFLHHVPENGKLLILFAPHVGIGPLGRVGALQRDGQNSVSSACGAAVGAYKELQKKKSVPSDPLTVLETIKEEDTDQFDPQLQKIIELLKPRLDGIEDGSDSIAFVSYQMYGIIRELLYGIIDQTPDVFDNASEVAIIGGVMINRRLGGDFFQPLSFESRKKGEETVDLFEETFGERPNLLPILGSEDAASRLFTNSNGSGGISGSIR